VAYRGASVDLPRINRWFRRWLMRQYIDRYEPLPKRLEAAPNTEPAA
jgi:hypothetical protein